MNLHHFGPRLRHMIDLHAWLSNNVHDQHFVIVDAGASRGEFFRAMRSCVHNAFFIGSFYHGFEPSKKNQKELKKHPGIILHPFAVAGKSKLVDFIEFDGPGGKYHQWGNILKNHTDLMKSAEGVNIDSYKVEAVGINDLHDFLKVNYIDYLKMDIEGAEYDVFHHMKRATADRIGQVSVEVHSAKAREMVMRRISQWKFNFHAVYANEIFFMNQDRK